MHLIAKLKIAALAAAAVLVLALSLSGQSVSNSGGSGTGFGVGPTLPATCTVGNAWFLTTAPAGSNWYMCTATNTWTLQGGGGTGPGTPPFSTSPTVLAGGTVSIAAATHNQGLHPFVVVTDAATNVVYPGGTIDPATGNLVIGPFSVAGTYGISVYGATGGFANPMTTTGDLIVGGASGVATRFAANGTGTQCFQENSSGVASWATCGSGGGGTGGTVVPKTTTYVNLPGDTGSLFTYNGSSIANTLPATPPTMPWIVGVHNLNASALTVGRNGNTINGGTSNISLIQQQSITCASDTVTGGNDVCDVPYVAVAPITFTPASNGISVSLPGAAGQIYAGSTPALTATPALGTDNSVAGTLQLANSAANAHTIWSSGATTTNTIAGFATAPTTGHVVDCTVASTTCTLHDSGLVTANVLSSSASGVQTFLTTPSGANFNSMITAGGIPIAQNSQSAAYTTVLSDGGKQILHPTADNSARTFTIDSNANVAYPVGTTLVFINQINTVTIAITSDTLTFGTLTGSRTLAAGGVATAVKVTSTIWFITGNSGLT